VEGPQIGGVTSGRCRLGHAERADCAARRAGSSRTGCSRTGSARARRSHGSRTGSRGSGRKAPGDRRPRTMKVAAALGRSPRSRPRRRPHAQRLRARGLGRRHPWRRGVARWPPARLRDGDGRPDPPAKIPYPPSKV